MSFPLLPPLRGCECVTCDGVMTGAHYESGVMSPLSPDNNVVPPEWLSDHLESYQGAQTIHSDMSIEFPLTINLRIMQLLRMYITW